ncbi:MAG: 6-bladed beta-propeller [Gemmatimonadota bacterium]|nr:6-bladed beta-propeller [Gemmatimonadota bacterium]MDE2864335.1 6-bladed beta-propeller [Gemmatimonadota bacterium]
MSSRVFASCFAAVLALSATTPLPLSPQPPSTVTDSAGVLIVESTSPAWPPGTCWRVATAPTLTIGDESGDLNYMFQGVSQAFRMDGGTIVVVDRLANQLSLFDAAGVFIRNLGGRGEGPGEFQFLQYAWASGDTIWASDGLLSRISVFDRSGEVLETIPVEIAPGMGSVAAATQFVDGAILVSNAPSGGSNLGTGDVIEGRVWTLSRYSAGGRFMNAISGLRGSSKWEHGIQGLSPGMYLPFSVGTPVYAGGNDHIYAGRGNEADIGRRHHDGTLSHLIRWAAAERPISDQDRRRFREANSAAPRYVEPTAWARYLREVPFPERIPVYRRLILDAERNLWAERYRAPWEGQPSWYVFDEQGKWLGEVATPRGLHVFEIGTDYVLGRYLDELDVQSVVMIPLDRGVGPGR